MWEPLRIATIVVVVQMLAGMKLVVGILLVAVKDIVLEALYLGTVPGLAGLGKVDYRMVLVLADLDRVLSVDLGMVLGQVGQGMQGVVHGHLVEHILVLDIHLVVVPVLEVEHIPVKQVEHQQVVLELPSYCLLVEVELVSYYPLLQVRLLQLECSRNLINKKEYNDNIKLPYCTEDLVFSKKHDNF